MSKLHYCRERTAAVSRLERAGLDSNLAVAVIDELDHEESRFGTAEQVARIDVGLASLQDEVRQIEPRLSGRMDAQREELLGRMDDHRDQLLGRMDDHREELIGRMDVQFDALRRENRLLLLFFSTILGLLMALFRFGLF